jgi:UDP-glucose:(heptosyl)LPS alpha-1,3-glucosyltransferase
VRIAFVVHDYGRQGGQSRYVHELATRFARDHEVHVFANRIGPERDSTIHFHHVPAWRRSALTTVVTFIVPATLLTHGLAGIRPAVEGGFDVVHAQGLCGLRQTVITAHMCLARWFEEQRRVQGGLRLKQRLFRALVLPLERRAFASRRTKEVIAVSSAVGRDLAACYRRADRVTVIPHAVDLEAFNPATRDSQRAAVRRELGAVEGDVLALYVGDLQKGAAEALRAVARVPGTRLALVSFSDQRGAAALAAELGVRDRVTFVPGSDRVERFYAAADVFLYPTLYDTFGMVIAEAMASGLPVVTTATAGASELIEDGVDGLVVPSVSDVASLAAALERLARDPELRSRVGAAARRKAERSTWDDVARRTLEVYARACGA